MWPPGPGPRRLQRGWRRFDQHPGYLDRIDRPRSYAGPGTPDTVDTFADYFNSAAIIGRPPIHVHGLLPSFTDGEFPMPTVGRPPGFGRPPRNYQMSAFDNDLQDPYHYTQPYPQGSPFDRFAGPSCTPFAHRHAGGRPVTSGGSTANEDAFEQGQASYQDKGNEKPGLDNEPYASAKAATHQEMLVPRPSSVSPFPGSGVRWDPYMNAWEYGHGTLVSAFLPNHDGVAGSGAAQVGEPPAAGSSEPANERSKDFYKRLNVREDTSQADIKKAYIELAKMYHPDRHRGNKDLEARFQEITEAYNVLGDAEQRMRYDESRTTESQSAPMPFDGLREHGRGVRFMIAPDGQKWFLWSLNSLYVERNGGNPYDLGFRPWNLPEFR